MKLVMLMLLLIPIISHAHKPSDSYLTIDLNGKTVSGRWDVALRDLDYAIGLDADLDGSIDWGELKAQHDAIAVYAFARLSFFDKNGECSTEVSEHQVDRHSDGAYAVLHFESNCATQSELTLNYRLFFDLDPTHRGLLRIQYPDGDRTAVLSPESSRAEIDPLAQGALSQFSDYWREGLWHIWKGFDHILFLAALLLPAVLRRENGRWRRADSLNSVLLSVGKIVTAFTLAHSITLGAAVLGWVNLPSRWVESLIAATIVLAAINNLFPLMHKHLWQAGFCLGLIHGFGFASVLSDLGLPSDALMLALLGFNLGIETGQLALVAVFIPLAYSLRSTYFYEKVVLGAGSVAIALIAVIWLFERSLNVDLASIGAFL